MRWTLCMALLLLPAGLAAQAGQPAESPRTIVVSGVGSVEREPDQGVIVVAVESEAPAARAAAEANAARMTQLVAALRRANVAERNIRTISYELRPDYARDETGREPARIVGYRAINMVQVTVDEVARLGGVIDAAIAAGANRVQSIQFQLRDRHAAHLAALAVALQNARREAEALAAAAGERLGPPITITSGGFAPVPPPMPYARADMEMAMATPIEAGTLNVMANVHVIYRLLDP